MKGGVNNKLGSLSTAHVRVHGNALLRREIAAVTNLPPDLIAAIQRAAQSVSEDKQKLAESRARYRKAIADAHAQGFSLAALGRALGVSRQHVKRIIDGE
jgi:hypothetical protein